MYKKHAGFLLKKQRQGIDNQDKNKTYYLKTLI